jgi:GT2 family glycosyltransferase
VTACVPQPSEILVVDQSEGTATETVVREFAQFGAHVIRNDARGVAEANNLGLKHTRHEWVAITHDDCTVAVDWIRIALELMARDPTAIYTGSVLPVGDPLSVPSTIDEPTARDYTGQIRYNILYPNNMVCARTSVLSLGGFDNRVLVAEDNDLCYRWLRAGRRLLYEPNLRVWHHDWRSREELKALYRNYGRSQGLFFAKHLRQGDLRMLQFMTGDVLGVARAMASAAVRRQPRRALPNWQMLAGLPTGLMEGWRDFAPR